MTYPGRLWTCSWNWPACGWASSAALKPPFVAGSNLERSGPSASPSRMRTSAWARVSAMSRLWSSLESSKATSSSTTPSSLTTGRPARTVLVLSATRITYWPTVCARDWRSSACCWSKYAPRRLTTSSPTRPSVIATTATKASVSRPWNVRGAMRSALGERVPDTANGLHEGGMRGVVLELVPEMADVDVDCLLVLVERLVVAEQVEQLRTRVDAARLARQVAQDLELGRGQRDAPVASNDPPPVEVDEQVAVADDPTADRIGEVAISSAEHGPDPAQQLAQAEGLGHVVVGAELEADDLVDLLVARGEHQDRRLHARGAQAAKHLEAVHPRQPDVEQHQVRRTFRGDVQALLAGAGEGHLVAFLLERVLDAPSDGVLVLDDQDRGGHGALMVGATRQCPLGAHCPLPMAWYRTRLTHSGGPVPHVRRSRPPDARSSASHRHRQEGCVHAPRRAPARRRLRPGAGLGQRLRRHP